MFKHYLPHIYIFTIYPIFCFGKKQKNESGLAMLMLKNINKFHWFGVRKIESVNSGAHLAILVPWWSIFKSQRKGGLRVINTLIKRSFYRITIQRNGITYWINYL